MQKTKVLLTGGSGFIGGHLKKRLQDEGHEVIELPRSYLQQPSELERFFNTQQPDYIFHLAAYGNQSFQENEYQTALVNYMGLVNLLATSKGLDYKAFIHFGSSSEYGETTKPMVETDPLLSQSFYGATKAGATLFARAFAKQFHKPIVIVRPFSVYGPQEADFRFIPTVIRCIMWQKEFQLEPNATHDWIYVNDVIDGIMTLLPEAKEQSGEVFNIGTGLSTRNDEVVGMLEEIVDKKAIFKKVSGLRPEHSYYWVADIHKISTLSKDMYWQPRFLLYDGLKETYEYYKVKFGNYCF